MFEHRAEIDSAWASPTFDKDGSFHVDKPVGSMSISPCGRDVVLASRQGLHIIDLDSPWTPPRHLPHLTPWDVADVQWSPFASRDYWVASTSNQKALVWNLAMSNPSASIEHVLHAHTRAITDINFSAHHPDLLATCSVDSFVHCWDLRFPARPAITFCDWFAGATQVKWNRQDGHIIASSHDKMLRIWDDRKGAYPLRSIAAHDTKIYGIDWNRTDAQTLATCSLDQTIKLWNYESEGDAPERVLRTPFPVWRARHTPFGHGLLAMPQRGDFNVHLYDSRGSSSGPQDAPVESVKQFTGHESQVKEFLWRSRGGFDNGNDYREFQLVTWGADLSLRLHRMPDEQVEKVGHKRGTPSNPKFESTRRHARYKTFQEDPAKSVESPSHYSGFHSGVEPEFEAYRQPIASIIPTPATALGGWMSGGFVNTFSGLRHGASARKDLDPISWMKGVKIGKREGPGEQGLASMTSPEPKSHRGSEEFESLGEEITHIGSKFSKVEFSLVDIQKRYVRFSMNGPWAENHSMTYLNCHARFPDAYPHGAPPAISIEKTGSLATDTQIKLQEDAKKIGTAYQSHGRSSFEAQIRYLQGEQTLEDLTAWTKDDTDTSIYGFASESEGSSSDDEDDLGAFVGKQDAEVGLTGSGVLSVSNVNANVPLAQTCGAVWTADGRLTCFFRTREEAPTSLVGTLGLDDPNSLSRLKKRGYEKFGRFYPPSSKGRSKTSSYGTIGSDDSGTDSGSDSSDLSSSSSVSARDPDSRGHYLGLQPSFRVDAFPFQRNSKLTDEAQRSNASLSATRSGSALSKSTISIYNMEHLIPSKVALAKKYCLEGTHAYLHNAQVAREEGLPDLAELWVLIDMILKDKVPLQAVPLPGNPPAVPALPISMPLKRVDSGVKLDDELSETVSLRAAVKWGDHPFGRTFLVQRLFQYFSQLADVQMLALMSCIFASPRQMTVPGTLDENGHSSPYSSSRHPLSTVLSSPSIASPNRVEYFPSVEVAFSVLQPHASKVIAVPSPPKGRVESASLSSSLGASGADPSGAFGSSLTPPMSFRSSRKSMDQPDMATSPDRFKWSYRSNSQSAGVLSTSLQRTFWSASASSSPPNASSRKRNSPVSSFGVTSGVHPPASALPQRLLSRSMSNAADDPQDKPTSADRPAKERQRQARPFTYQVWLKNQDQFSNDGYSDGPLLDAADAARHCEHRQLYADLLSAWGLPLERAAMLKFNASDVCAPRADAAPGDATPDFLLGGRHKPTPGAWAPQGLQPRRACATCGSAGSASWAATGRCEECGAAAAPTVCALCEEVVRGRASPCLACGHVLHARCRALAAPLRLEWGDGAGCVSGCGCRCDDYSRAAEDMIQTGVGAAEARRSRAPSTVRGGAGGDGRQEDEDGEEAHEDVAYQSLKKNLGGFGKTKSRVWKGKSRASSVTGAG